MTDAGPNLAHIVFFTLKDQSSEAIETMAAACREFLSGHPGETYFSVGTLVDDLNREVNDREFDVALHVVFDSRAGHDQYQTSPRHVQFIEENKEKWAKVRIFDSYC